MAQKKIWAAILLCFAASAFSCAFAQNQISPADKTKESFLREFGLPPEIFTDQLVTSETLSDIPGFIPDDVKRIFPEKDILKIYCAEIKWKTGNFFSTLDGLSARLTNFSGDLTAVGIEMPLPEVRDIRTEGQKKLQNICDSDSLSKAEKSSQEFYNWSGEQKKIILEKLRSKAEEQIKIKEAEFKEKIKKDIEAFYAEQRNSSKEKIQKEIQKISANKANGKAEIQSKVAELIKVQQAEMERKVRIKAEELLAGDSLAKVVPALVQWEKGLAEEIAQNQKTYDQYKQEAFALRKEAVLKLADQNITAALAQLESAKGELEAEKDKSGKGKTYEEAKMELEDNLKQLGLTLEKAASQADSEILKEALHDFQKKWDVLRRSLGLKEKDATQKICAKALDQFKITEDKISSNLDKIGKILEICGGKAQPDCIKANTFADRLEVIRGKMKDLQTGIAFTREICGEAEKADQDVLAGLLNKILSDSYDLQKHAAAFEADKKRLSETSFSSICQGSLARIESAKREIEKNDYLLLKDYFYKCQKKENQCQENANLSQQFSSYTAEIKKFNELAKQGDSLCKSFSSGVKILELLASLGEIEKTGEQVRLLGKKIESEIFETKNKKIFCRSLMPQLFEARVKIGKDLEEIGSIETNCKGKDAPKCVKALELASNTASIRNKSVELFKRIGEVWQSCADNDTNPPDALFSGNAKNLFLEIAQLNATIQDYFSQTERIGTGEGDIWIEAESASGFQPRLSAEAPSVKEIYPIWRPPYFGSGDVYLGTAKDFVTYEFEVRAGTYSFWIRDFTDNYQAPGARSVNIYINGKKYGSFAETGAVADSPAGIFSWHKIGENISLASGRQKIKIEKEKSNGAPAIIDAVFLTQGVQAPQEKYLPGSIK